MSTAKRKSTSVIDEDRKHRELYISKRPCREFRYDKTRPIGDRWVVNETKDECQIRLPSGQIVAIPNFNETFYDFYINAPIPYEFTTQAPDIDQILEDRRRLLAKSDISFFKGLIPYISLFDGISIPDTFSCDPLTGTWSYHRDQNHGIFLEEYGACMESLLAEDILNVDNRLKKLETVFDAICAKASWIDDVMKIVRETTTEKDTQ